MKRLPRGQEALKVVQSVHRKIKRTKSAELEGAVLEKFLDDIQVRLQGVHDVIRQTWFTPEQ